VTPGPGSRQHGRRVGLGVHPQWKGKSEKSRIAIPQSEPDSINPRLLCNGPIRPGVVNLAIAWWLAGSRDREFLLPSTLRIARGKDSHPKSVRQGPCRVGQRRGRRFGNAKVRSEPPSHQKAASMARSAHPTANAFDAHLRPRRQYSGGPSARPRLAGDKPYDPPGPPYKNRAAQDCSQPLFLPSP
jgi:hypothetical protein